MLHRGSSVTVQCTYCPGPGKCDPGSSRLKNDEVRVRGDCDGSETGTRRSSQEALAALGRCRRRQGSTCPQP